MKIFILVLVSIPSLLWAEPRRVTGIDRVSVYGYRCEKASQTLAREEALVLAATACKSENFKIVREHVLVDHCQSRSNDELPTDFFAFVMYDVYVECM